MPIVGGSRVRPRLDRDPYGLRHGIRASHLSPSQWLRSMAEQVSAESASISKLGRAQSSCARTNISNSGTLCQREAAVCNATQSEAQVSTSATCSCPARLSCVQLSLVSCCATSTGVHTADSMVSTHPRTDAWHIADTAMLAMRWPSVHWTPLHHHGLQK